MNYVNSVQQMFYNDRIGKIYGCFEVIDVQYDSKEKRQIWTMRCIHCGLIKQTKNGKDYVKGKNHGICKCQRTKSIISPKIKKAPAPRMRDHELYCRWWTIKDRCYDESDKDFPNYGGRGIKMCDEWREDFWSFVRWAESSGYEKSLTIDRIDPDGNYAPDNCRWVPRYMQNKNKRNVKLIDGLTLPDYCKENGLSYNIALRLLGEGKSMDDVKQYHKEMEDRAAFCKMCREEGANPYQVRFRMKHGYTLEEALHGKRKCEPIEINGESKSLSEWCKIYGITTVAVKYRMGKGMSVVDAITRKKTQGVKIE